MLTVRYQSNNFLSRVCRLLLLPSHVTWFPRSPPWFTRSPPWFTRSALWFTRSPLCLCCVGAEGGGRRASPQRRRPLCGHRRGLDGGDAEEKQGHPLLRYAHSLTHSPSLSILLTRSPTHHLLLTQPPSFTHPLSLSYSPSLTFSLTHSASHSPSLTFSLTHSHSSQEFHICMYVYGNKKQENKTNRYIFTLDIIKIYIYLFSVNRLPFLSLFLTYTIYNSLH